MLSLSRIGAYTLVRELGAGGMGAVYEAVHDQLGRRAAIKVLHPRFAHDPEVSARFLKEARATNMVQHPGLVRIYENGQLPDGTAYIVMEHLGGVSLRQRLQQHKGRLGSPALRYARQIAAALAQAHACGVVHRDLKPANVMLVPDPTLPGGERVKVLDFGIAKVAATDDTGLTRTGAMMGTPSYMSPEQCRNAAAAGERSDVYSLGVMLYEMLAGRRPFIGESDMDVAVQHITEPPPPLLDAVPPGSVAPALATLVDRMLAKRPDQRPSMLEVAQALDEVLDAPSTSTPTLASGDAYQAAALALSASGGAQVHSTLGRSAAQTLPPIVPRRSPLRSAGLLAGVALLSGLAVVLLLRRPTPPSAAVAAPSPTPTPAPPAPLRWSLRTRPAGAQVLRAADGQLQGLSPWTRELPPGAGTEALLVRLAGYKERRVELSRERAEDLELTLEPRPAPPPRRAPAPRTIRDNKDVEKLR